MCQAALRAGNTLLKQMVTDSIYDPAAAAGDIKESQMTVDAVKYKSQEMGGFII